MSKKGRNPNAVPKGETRKLLSYMDSVRDDPKAKIKYISKKHLGKRIRKLLKKK